MTLPQADEINFDGLPGPTHNYGGLSVGNLASMSHLGEVSNPRAAALQGLQKMRTLMKIGLTQGLLLPHERPFMPGLRNFGFSGTDRQIVEQAGKVAPALLANLSSASSMWTANAATVSPSADTKDGKVHFTPANLASMYHRSIEHPLTARMLARIFADPDHFVHHPAIPCGGAMGDEGAANHGRFANAHGDQGVELFVYGRSAFEKLDEAYRFPPRQALETSHAVATTHGLTPGSAVYIRQSTAAINAGAFHNDVVAVTNGPALFYHELAFEDRASMQDTVTRACTTAGIEPLFLEVPADEVSLEDAVASYLFNSQLVTLPEGGMALILPKDAENNPHTKRYVESLTGGNGPVTAARFLDLKQSMKNGGGPACLRLRVVLTDAEQAALGGTCLLNEARLQTLEDWVKNHYRDRLAPGDLADPDLMEASRKALDELTTLLGLGSLYDFQIAGG